MAFGNRPLWSAVLKKEALDLLVAVWPRLDAGERRQLLDAILAGPERPATPQSEADQNAERQREWQIYERLVEIRRAGKPPLPDDVQKRLQDLERDYGWEPKPPDQARFSMWMESHEGYPTDFTADDLSRLSTSEILERLPVKGENYEGRLIQWQEAVRRNPHMGVSLLHSLAADQSPATIEINTHTLYGLRETVTDEAVLPEVIGAVSSVPAVILNDPKVLSSAVDVVVAATRAHGSEALGSGLLTLWDQLFDAVRRNPSLEAPDNDDWVFRAINSPAGRLAQALLDMVFRQERKVGEGLPNEVRRRLTQFADPEVDVFRLSRVVMAQRLYYLFAVDPEWCHGEFIPFFDWSRSEEEALALWRGYGWHAHIDPTLWDAVKDQFFEAFTPRRIQRLEAAADNLARLLVAVAVEFPATEIPVDRTRAAMRMMTPHQRASAVTWLQGFVEGPRNAEFADVASARHGRSDEIWRERVKPFLNQFWPVEAVMVDAKSAVSFAQIAIATHHEFNDAVATVRPFLVPVEWPGPAFQKLLKSQHPETHPRSCFELVTAMTDEYPERSFSGYLREVLDRLLTADPTLREDHRYNRLNAWLKASE